MKRRWIFVIILIGVLGAVLIYSGTRREKSVAITAKVEFGKFDVVGNQHRQNVEILR
jgi:hypothetical protein